MLLKDGKYNAELHHNSYLAVGVPGTVAGLHLAWKEQGKLPWKRLVEPADRARARRLPGQRGAGALAEERCSDSMQKYPASVAQFSKNGVPYEAGETLKQPDLARTLERIADAGAGRLLRRRDRRGCIEKEMLAHGGLITRDDLKNYTAEAPRAGRRAPTAATRSSSMPPPSARAASR